MPSPTLPGPTTPAGSRTQVFLDYLDYFRSMLATRVDGLSDHDLRTSRLPSGWTPLELVKHVTFVEMRWLEWGFEGQEVADPWGDGKDGRWYVASDETLADLLAQLHAQGQRSRAVIEAHELADRGEPGERWDGEQPPQLERVLFHLLQEYARHTGHLDVVRELIDGTTGE